MLFSIRHILYTVVHDMSALCSNMSDPVRHLIVPYDVIRVDGYHIVNVYKPLSEVWSNTNTSLLGQLSLSPSWGR